jgi:hypothetical protein
MHAVSLDYNRDLFQSFEDHLEFCFFTNRNGYAPKEAEGDSILYFPGDRGNPFVIALTNTKGAVRKIKVYQIKAMGESQGDPFEHRLMECLKKTINFKGSFRNIGIISDKERAKCRVAMKIEEDIIPISQVQTKGVRLPVVEIT